MSLRERIRRWRLYYRSRPLFEAMLERPRTASWLPWIPGHRTVELRFRSGRTFSMPARRWSLLPTACRLERIGAEFEFLDDAKRVRIEGLTLYSPLWARDEAANYGEVLLGDVYDVRERNLAGRMVVDVGAYVGDSAIAFARRGASVHAFEPSVAFCRFMHRNLLENGVADRVRVHEVGLAEREQVVQSRHDRLRFVEGVSYALAKLPSAVDLLKMDCEGAEYYLLSDPRFLEHLAPREIRMEYHRGLRGVLKPLKLAGYEVTLQRSIRDVGIVSARRKRAVAQSLVRLGRVA